MKNFAVFWLLVSLFYILEAGRVRNTPIEFEEELPEKDYNEDLHYLEDEQSSRKSKQSSGVKDDSSFYFKIKQQKVTKTKAGVKKVTKVHETKKVDGQNATSTSYEVIRYPNGTKVIKGKPPMKKTCSDNKDCGAGKYCGLLEQCKNCTTFNGFCFRNSQCSWCLGNSVVCYAGQCIKVDRSGKAGSYCSKDSDCNKNRCCVPSAFAGICKPFPREGESCGGLFSFSRACPCADGLDCSGMGFLKICKKKGKKEVKSDAELDDDFFDEE